MLATSNVQRLLGQCFRIQSWMNSTWDFAYHTTEQMMWHQQQLLQQQERPQRWWNWDTDEDEEENTDQLGVEDLFLKQLHSMQHGFWAQETSTDWWEWLDLQTWGSQQ